MFQLLRPVAPAPRLPADRIDPEYRRLRRQVFVGIFVGYAAYYLVRNTLALAIPDLLREYPHYSKAMLGTAMTGLSIAYGVSKFLMGSVSDRSNPRYFLPLGLLLSAAIVFASGTLKWIYSSIALVIALQTLNGWVQGMGWPPCGKSMVHWWSTKERGLTVATWNVAHNVGGARVANRLPPARRPALPPDLARAPLSAADSPPGTWRLLPARVHAGTAVVPSAYTHGVRTARGPSADGAMPWQTRRVVGRGGSSSRRSESEPAASRCRALPRIPADSRRRQRGVRPTSC